MARIVIGYFVVLVLASASMLWANPSDSVEYQSRIYKEISGTLRSGPHDEMVFLETPYSKITLFHDLDIFDDTSCGLDTFAVFLYNNISIIEKEFKLYQQRKEEDRYDFSLDIDSLGKIRYFSLNTTTFCFDCIEEKDPDSLEDQIQELLKKEEWVRSRTKKLEIIGSITSQEAERKAKEWLKKREEEDRKNCKETTQPYNDSIVYRTLRTIEIPVFTK